MPYNVKGHLSHHSMPVTWNVASSSFAFLTYSQVNHDVDDFICELQAAFDCLGASRHLVAHELHEDGGNHYHCLVQWTSGFTSRDERVFDVGGFHPNYKSVRRGADQQRVRRYCLKDGAYYGDTFDDVDDVIVKRKRDDVWSEIVGATSVVEFWSLVQRLAPYEYVNNYSRLASYATARYDQPAAYVPRYTDFVVPGVMAAWEASLVSGV
jgi:hypothetical protein